MKRILGHKIVLTAFILFISAGLFILNLRTTYYQGLDYKVRQVRIPLYLKFIDFFSRHYHYRELTREITADCKGEKVRAIKLLSWTYENLKRNPNGLPVVDDHVWHIIIRGYGESDQFQDVFTTLCNYAGLKAFFIWLCSDDKKMPLSFVKIEGRWFVFDPYYAVYFQDKKGGLADIGTLREGDYIPKSQKEGVIIPDYRRFLCNIPRLTDAGLGRASIQSPLNRLIFIINKWTGRQG